MAGFAVCFEAKFQEGAAEALHFDPFGGFGYRDMHFGAVPGLAVFRVGKTVEQLAWLDSA